MLAGILENHVLAEGTLHLTGERGRSCAQNWQMMNLGVIDPIWGRKELRDLSALHLCFWN